MLSGTYKSVGYEIKKDISVYGGFSLTDDVRSFDLSNPVNGGLGYSIFSGDILGNDPVQDLSMSSGYEAFASIDGKSDNASRIFLISGARQVRFFKVSIEDAFNNLLSSGVSDGAGLYVGSGVRLTLHKVSFKRNAVLHGRGGGLAAVGDGSRSDRPLVRGEDVLFEGNVAGFRGGAVFAQSAYISFVRLRVKGNYVVAYNGCLLYTSPSPRDRQKSRMPSSA